MPSLSKDSAPNVQDVGPAVDRNGDLDREPRVVTRAGRGSVAVEHFGLRWTRFRRQIQLADGAGDVEALLGELNPHIKQRQHVAALVQRHRAEATGRRRGKPVEGGDPVPR